jgi:hypothetical protein
MVLGLREPTIVVWKLLVQCLPSQHFQPMLDYLQWIHKKSLWIVPHPRNLFRSIGKSWETCTCVYDSIYHHNSNIILFPSFHAYEMLRFFEQGNWFVVLCLGWVEKGAKMD